MVCEIHENRNRTNNNEFKVYRMSSAFVSIKQGSWGLRPRRMTSGQGKQGSWLGLMCSSPLSAILQLYSGGQYY